MVEILLASAEHGPGLTAVSDSVRYIPGEASGQAGYLITARSPDEYGHRVTRSGCSVVAIEDGLVVAFLVAVPGLLLDELSQQDPVRPLAKAGGPLEDYLLVDQIGIRPSHKGTGLGTAMVRRVLELARPKRWGASIMQEPVKNLRSIGLFAGKFGLQLQATVPDKGFVFGYYERTWPADQA